MLMVKQHKGADEPFQGYKSKLKFCDAKRTKSGENREKAVHSNCMC